MGLVYVQQPDVNFPAVDRLIDLLRGCQFDVALHLLPEKPGEEVYIRQGARPNPAHLHIIEGKASSLQQIFDKALDFWVPKTGDRKYITRMQKAKDYILAVTADIHPELSSQYAEDMFVDDWLEYVLSHWVPVDWDTHGLRGSFLEAIRSHISKDFIFELNHYASWDQGVEDLQFSPSNASGVKAYYSAIATGKFHTSSDAKLEGTFFLLYWLWGSAKSEACGRIPFEKERGHAKTEEERLNRLRLELGISSLSSVMVDSLRNTSSTYRFA